MSGLLRAPRLLVLANGQPLPAFEAEVLSNNHYAADRFRVRAAASQLPPGLMSEVEIMLEIQASLDAGGNFTRLILGAVDTLDLDPVSGTLDLSGRDLAAGLIETRTQETFANQTSSEIATTLAGRHGLEPDVQATTTPVGRYWQLEHDRIVLDQFARATTEWDLLVDSGAVRRLRRLGQRRHPAFPSAAANRRRPRGAATPPAPPMSPACGCNAP